MRSAATEEVLSSVSCLRFSPPLAPSPPRLGALLGSDTICAPAYSSPHQDVHITSDDVIIMFHDPSLERTTDGKGLIREQSWAKGIENVRTTKQPCQQIPTFQQVCDLLMRPENQHVKLNVSCSSALPTCMYADTRYGCSD